MPEIDLRVDEQVVIAPAAEGRAANNATRHPDGSIWLNTTWFTPGLLRSGDGGRTWQTVPVSLSEIPPSQYVASLFATGAGRLCLLHQANERDLGEGEVPDPRAFSSWSDDDGVTWE